MNQFPLNFKSIVFRIMALIIIYVSSLPSEQKYKTFQLWTLLKFGWFDME